MTVPNSLGVGLFTEILVTRFAVATKILALKLSPTVVGSVWSPAAAVVVFVIVVPQLLKLQLLQ